MISVKHAFINVVLGIALAAWHMQAYAQPQGFDTPTDHLITGAQPSQADLLQLKNAGITKVINLRGPNEDIPFDEKAEMEALGLEYVSLPISGAVDVTSTNAKKLHDLLASDEKLFLHCASGNRVGALLAIRAHLIEGKPMDESLEFGRAAGLSSLEGRVKSVLEESATTRR